MPRPPSKKKPTHLAYYTQYLEGEIRSGSRRAGSVGGYFQSLGPPSINVVVGPSTSTYDLDTRLRRREDLVEVLGAYYPSDDSACISRKLGGGRSQTRHLSGQHVWRDRV